MPGTARIDVALASLKDTFLRRPGAPLTEVGVACLCHLDRDFCKALLSALHDVRFLACDAEGLYRLAPPPSRDDGRPAA